jgi:hypothetical protein
VGEDEGRRGRQWRTEVREEEGDVGRQREVRDGSWFERKRETPRYPRNV